MSVFDVEQPLITQILNFIRCTEQKNTQPKYETHHSIVNFSYTKAIIIYFPIYCGVYVKGKYVIINTIPPFSCFFHSHFNTWNIIFLSFMMLFFILCYQFTIFSLSFFGKHKVIMISFSKKQQLVNQSFFHSFFCFLCVFM